MQEGGRSPSDPVLDKAASARVRLSRAHCHGTMNGPTLRFAGTPRL